VEYGPGSFLHAPKNTVHGPHRAEKEVISVTWYDGPLSVENANTEDPAPAPIPQFTNSSGSA
jgi:quercetin dioxygenase-like cupin family protein